MNMPLWLEASTLLVLLLVLCTDLVLISRRPHEPSAASAALWVSGYAALAVLFGCGILVWAGSDDAGQFFAGWLTEYSLSVDNLFVFGIIMGQFAVPREYQMKVLIIGIIVALVMRGAFIAAGAAIIVRFGWVFYIFGAFLLYTAVKLLRERGQPQEPKENALLRWMRTVVPVTVDFGGGRLRVKRDGRRVFTPMAIVIVALGTTDLLFALDSIPAIFGLTRDAYLVFTANVFALMGLTQLYFLLGRLLDRLVHLGVGLAVILAFIGLKLIAEAIHENQLPFINGGRPVTAVPEVPIWLSLGVIIVTLAATAITSLRHSRRHAPGR